jgi:hypothetical protein
VATIFHLGLSDNEVRWHFCFLSKTYTNSMLNFYYLQRPKLPGVCHFSLYYNYSDKPYLLEQICVLYNPDTIALFYRNAYWLCINIFDNCIHCTYGFPPRLIEGYWLYKSLFLF